MATLALFLAIGGTAMAAVTLTGKNVADKSLTSVDVKAQSLGVADLTLAAKNALKGAKGATGRAGSIGSTGITGVDGSQGKRGTAAFMTSAFAYRDTGLVTSRTNASPRNNNGGAAKDWDDPTYASTSCPGSTCPQIRAPGSYEPINLTSAWQPMVSLTGMGGADAATRSPNSLLNLTFANGFLNVTGSLTFLHRRNGENLTTNSGGTLVHGRIECALFYGTSGDPNALTTIAGVPGQASSGHAGINHELVNIALNGNASGLAAGSQYNATIKCRDADYTGNASPQWQLARGNLTALASQ
jgi:hypothetical protein